MKIEFEKFEWGIEAYNKKGEQLGTISFYEKWKKYVWEQEKDIIMSRDCLKQIDKKMEELENEIKKNLSKRKWKKKNQQ